ncbi:4-phosphoerythronate dehydrogenase [Litorilituus lipolyticus]|uniref:Erythronate-4-phosphate dehydrogenase n=1 Tax=Litorilituus lipolyticus TaxID=2491017 RepID=A0A502LB75_9GAMM|nr:4-phosphoerythronate dehydrogenase [Litorilituus lipolyticus]TPH19203.1 4-phosphoerythronate dehydrogenase [Litorilituus lipolyticus]
MNIFYDENMPFAHEFFSELGNLYPFSGRELQAQDIKNADVLLVRSITQVNEALLKQAPQLKFVGTATIGTDHIDQEYLKQQSISFHSAPGCNAISVAEYVLSALVVLAERYLINLSTLTVGIVGAGNTGTRLAEKLSALNIHFKLCDPILEAKQKQGSNDTRQYYPLEEVLACDVISIHVPKTVTGEHRTVKLLDQQRLLNLRPEQILISACRGEVIDNHALLRLKEQGHGVKLVLDVWEGEPNVLQALIPYTEIATAHIAGYSLEGKARGSEMLYQALCNELKIAQKFQLNDFLPAANISSIEITQQFDQIVLNQIVKMVYDVRRDDAIFRQQLSEQGFDTIRKTYPARREFSSVSVTLSPNAYSDVPHRLGFTKTSN